MPSILLVDDDRELCLLMEEFFREHGFQIKAVTEGQLGLQAALERPFDLILLDVMLPGVDGFEILRQVRRRSSVPIIMLTARTEQRDRIAGLNAGADDYLPKPFGPEELLARIRAVLRRSGSPSAAAAAIAIGDIKVDVETRRVSIQGDAVELTGLEFDILEFLARSAGKVVTRDALALAMYQRPSTPYERSLDVHISHLRKKLEQRGNVRISTIRGVGYMIAAEAKAE